MHKLLYVVEIGRIKNARESVITSSHNVGVPHDHLHWIVVDDWKRETANSLHRREEILVKPINEIGYPETLCVLR